MNQQTATSTAFLLGFFVATGFAADGCDAPTAVQLHQLLAKADQEAANAFISGLATEIQERDIVLKRIRGATSA
jgi:hypothetical protein